MSSKLRIIAIGAGLALLSGGALAEPLAKIGKSNKPAPGDDGYYVPYVAGQDGQKRSVMDVPGSVTVISRKVMDDQQSRSVADALRNAPGVTDGGR